MIRAKANLKQATQIIKNTEKTIPRAYYAALQRAAQRVKTEAGREVRKKYYAKAKDIDQNVTIRRGSFSSMSTTVVWKGRNIPLINFKSNPKKPLSRGQRPPRILKAGVRKPGVKGLRGGFVAKVGKGGHIGVFKRVGRRRLPIEEIYGPATPVMVNEPGIIDSLVKVAESEVEKRFEHELNRRLKKGGLEI